MTLAQGADGESVYRVTLSDISERKRAEEALLASEERYCSLFQQASDGMFYLFTNLGIMEINASFARMHGYR